MPRSQRRRPALVHPEPEEFDVLDILHALSDPTRMTIVRTLRAAPEPRPRGAGGFRRADPPPRAAGPARDDVRSAVARPPRPRRRPLPRGRRPPAPPPPLRGPPRAGGHPPAEGGKPPVDRAARRRP